MKNLTEHTISGFLWVASGSGVQAILKIGIVAALARLVSPDEFGLIGAALVVVGFSAVFSELGVSQALIQRKDLEERHLTTAFSFSIGMGLVFYLLVIIFAGAIGSFFRMSALEELLPVVGLIFVFGGFSLVPQALMLRNFRFKVTSTIGVISYAVGYGGIGVLLAVQGWGVWALLFGVLSQHAIRTILTIIAQKHPKRLSFDYSAFKDLFYFGSGTTVARIGSFLGAQGDNLVIGRVLGPVALGLYGRAYALMVMPVTVFGGVLNKVLFPAMAKVQDEPKRLGDAYLTSVGAIAFFALPVAAMVFVLSPELIMVLLGADWIEAVVPLQVLAGGLLFRMSYKSSDALTRAAGAVYRRAWRQLVFALLVIALSYVGSRWGLPGVSFGVVAALLINFLLMAQLSLNLTGTTWTAFCRVHFNGLLLGCCTAVVASLLIYWIRPLVESSLIRLLSVTVGTAGLLGVTMLVYPRPFFNPSLFRICGKVSKVMFKYDIVAFCLAARMGKS